MQVSLKEITRENLRAICRLDAGDGGEQVAPNAIPATSASVVSDRPEAGRPLIQSADQAASATTAQTMAIGSECRLSACNAFEE